MGALINAVFDAASSKSLVLIGEGKDILKTLDVDAPEFFPQIARLREILLLLDAQAEAARQFQDIEQRYAKELQANAENGAPLPAPNGAPSNLNRQQWALARTPNFKRWFGEYEISEKVAEQVSTLVEDALAYRNPDSVNLWVIPDWQVREIKKLIGIDVSGYSFELVENDIRHAIGAHGDSKKEAKRKPSNEAITESDLKALPYILKSPDRIRAGTEKGGRKSVIFEKRVNGVIAAVEVIATTEGKLLNKTMWKRLGAEGGDAQSETAPPIRPNLPPRRASMKT
jgi:hypothetical protein